MAATAVRVVRSDRRCRGHRRRRPWWARHRCSDRPLRWRCRIPGGCRTPRCSSPSAPTALGTWPSRSEASGPAGREVWQAARIERVAMPRRKHRLRRGPGHGRRAGRAVAGAWPLPLVLHHGRRDRDRRQRPREDGASPAALRRPGRARGLAKSGGIARRRRPAWTGGRSSISAHWTAEDFGGMAPVQEAIRGR